MSAKYIMAIDEGTLVPAPLFLITPVKKLPTLKRSFHNTFRNRVGSNMTPPKSGTRFPQQSPMF
jgi:hypothetical protein